MATPTLPEPVELVFQKVEPSTGADQSKTPVILGHGLFGNKESWTEIPAKLADQTKRTVYVVDHRNHGDSPRTDELTFGGKFSQETFKSLDSFDQKSIYEYQPLLLFYSTQACFLIL